MSRLIVVGSSNVDLTARVSSLPKPGETIGGATLVQANGGKGANQAVAAGRLGSDVLFITCVGDDDHGRMLHRCFAADGIDTSAMKFSPDTPTGVALIYVDDAAENCIAVAPGANGKLLPEDIEAARKYFKEAEFLLVQLEIPMPTVLRAVSIAKEYGVKVVLNPAPMFPLRDELLSGLWLITPNETEAEKLSGIRVDSCNAAKAAARVLQDKGVENVIVTMGSSGALVCTLDSSEFVPARKVEAVDTTGAGDVFNGALLTALTEGKDLFEAARFATLASAVSVTRMGAQTSVPYRNEIQ